MTRKRIIISRDQGRLPFSGRGRGGVFAHASPLERGAMALSIAVFFLSAFSYMYFVMASVAHVAARGSLEHDVALLSADVAKLESKYFARSEEITETFAHAHGYVAATKSAYVERASLVSLKDTR